MKKLLLFALLSIVLVGCSKDEGFSPVGKTYVHTWKGGFSDNFYTYNIRFVNHSDYEFTYRKQDNILESKTEKYSLDYPNILFKSFGTTLAEDEEGVFIDENTIRIGSSEYILKK